LPGWNISASSAMKPAAVKAASVPGTMMNDCAKMMGITPAAFTRMGTKLFCPS